MQDTSPSEAPRILALPRASIQVSPNRQRRTFNPNSLSDLMNSISERGLLQLIGVRPSNGSWELVHGERRMKAIEDLWSLGGQLRVGDQTFPAGTFPCIPLSEMSPLEAEEAELAENLHREDLTWPERCAAISRLSKLRTQQAAAAGLPAPTPSDIAKEVFEPKRDGFDSGDTAYGTERTRRELIVAKYLDQPDVVAAKSVDDAFKILKRKSEAARNVALAEEVGRIFNSGMHQVLNCDSLEWMRQATPGQFDVILTDPPYGMNADEFGDGAGAAAGAHLYDDSAQTWTEIMYVFSKESFRLAKPQAHLYVFCDLDKFHELRTVLGLEGWWTHRTPLVWHKPNSQRVPWPEHGPRRCYELILYAVKGKRPCTQIFPDVITCPPDAQLNHQAQKPVALFTDLLKRSVRPGDSVFDPFAGTGPILPAAHSLKCIATAIDSDASAYGTMIKRLKELA